VLQRLFTEKTEQIKLGNNENELNVDDLLYEIQLSIILGNNFNSDEINLNLIKEMDLFDRIIQFNCKNEQLSLKQLCHLIPACIMCSDLDVCDRFVEYLNEKTTITNNTQINEYILTFLSILIRSTVYEMDELNRRLRTKRETLERAGETLFDLRAQLPIRRLPKTLQKEQVNNLREISEK
ncbi:unnamed protein product, partial [Didymodactylos carnosus]